MEKLTDRLTRYLLKRLRRCALSTLYDRAASAGLLKAEVTGHGEQSCRVWTITERARRELSGIPALDRKTVERMMRANRALATSRTERSASARLVENPVGDPFEFDPPTESAAKGAHRSRRKNVRSAGEPEVTAVDGHIDLAYLTTLLREHLLPPNPVHTAVALLVARAIGTSLPDVGPLNEAMRAEASFVLLKAPVKRFELCFATMLEDGLILPYRTTLEDVLRGTPLSGRYNRNQPMPDQRLLKTLSGRAVTPENEKIVRRQLRQALLNEPAPVLLVDETVFALTPVVTETADYVFECMGFDCAMIAELLHLCVGIAPKDSLRLMDDMAFDPDGLSLDDIALAVRPGRSAQQTLSVLAMLAERSAATEKSEGRDGGDRDNSGRKSRSGGGQGDKAKRTSQTGDVEVIEPVAVVDSGPSAEANAETPVSNDRVLCVETLAGYGPARDWAMDLKADLSLWKAGDLGWDQMSTRLLLSGPPGTGKTTFARALCNTLQVPLMVTSVANWLEPGFLGDVLKRMSAAFALAEKNAPAILFIDEIDNIGKRQTAGTRNYDDYWTSLINRLLELMDGASKSEGVVVVGATNLAERMDPALLRSGRLETHVRIPMPDIEALTGILGHHLGSDLAAVLASAPGTRKWSRLRPPPARNGKPLRRKPSIKPETEKGPRHD